MKIPTLNFELEIINSLLNSDNKFYWFIQQFQMEYNTDTQLALIFMIGFIFISIFLVYDAERYSQYLPGKPKRLIIRLLFFPLTTITGYYLSKLLFFWTIWLSTLGWWFIPALLGSALAFLLLLLFIIKFVDKK